MGGGSICSPDPHGHHQDHLEYPSCDSGWCAAMGSCPSRLCDVGFVNLLLTDVCVFAMSQVSSYLRFGERGLAASNAGTCNAAQQPVLLPFQWERKPPDGAGTNAPGCTPYTDPGRREIVAAIHGLGQPPGAPPSQLAIPLSICPFSTSKCSITVLAMTIYRQV